jgi:uncharacterized protein YbcV (DUF1398 family)
LPTPLRILCRLARVLHDAGVYRNEWLLPAAQSIYYTGLGPVVQQETPIATGLLGVPDFDQDALVRALRADQAGATTFPEFLAASWQAGVVRFTVDLRAREVTYYGWDGKSYVESYPDMPVPQP